MSMGSVVRLCYLLTTDPVRLPPDTEPHEAVLQSRDKPTFFMVNGVRK